MKRAATRLRALQFCLPGIETLNVLSSHCSLITSPPLYVPMARQVARLMVLETNRTEPSAMPALTAPAWMLRAAAWAFCWLLLSVLLLGPPRPTHGAR